MLDVSENCEFPPLSSPERLPETFKFEHPMRKKGNKNAILYFILCNCTLEIIYHKVKAKMLKSDEIMLSLDKRECVLTEMSAYLSQLESQLSLIFAASPDMILFIHKDGQIIKSSQAIWKILGYHRDELVGKYIWDYIHPDDIEKTKDIRYRLITNDKIIYFDKDDCFVNRWRKKDGSYAKLAWRFSIYDAQEDNTIGFATDVTNLMMENPFNFGLLYRAISMTHDGIIITDYKDNNAIIYANESFCKNTGYKIEELLRQNCRILQSDDKEQAALKTIREAINKGEGCEVLLRNWKKNKSVFFNHILISPIVENGVITNYIGISRNLTDLINSGVYVWDRKAPRGFGSKPERSSI